MYPAGSHAPGHTNTCTDHGHHCGPDHFSRRDGDAGTTQTLPPEYGLTFQVTPNSRTTDPITYVALNGGSGMNFVTEIEIILTRPDGTQQTEIWTPPFSMGQNVGFPCSTISNRVEIWTTAPTVGKIKVYDEIVPFK